MEINVACTVKRNKTPTMQYARRYTGNTERLVYAYTKNSKNLAHFIAKLGVEVNYNDIKSCKCFSAIFLLLPLHILVLFSQYVA